MKKPLLLAPLCMLTTLLSYSQNSSKFTFKLGEEYDLPRKTEDLAFFGNEKDGIVNLSMKKEEIVIVRFDARTLDKTIEKKIDLPEFTRNFNSELLVDFNNNNNYFWLHSDWDKSNEIESLFYDKIDVSTGKIVESNHKLLESKKLSGSVAMTGMYSYKTVDKYTFNYDAQRKKLLVSYRLNPEVKNDKNSYDIIGLHVFDENMKKIWGNEFTMPYTEAIMDNSDFSIDANGNAYMLAKVYDSDRRKERDKSSNTAAYHYEVLKFTKGSKKVITAPIMIENNFIIEATLTENSNHEMIVSCTYSKKAKGKGVGTDGIFLAIVNQEGKLVKYKNGFYEFPIAEITKFESARQSRKREKDDDYELPNLQVRNVLVDNDGGIFIACEEYVMVSHTRYDSRGRMYTSYSYHYNDIYGVRINAEGKFEWLRKIPKVQTGTNGRGTMSFKLINDETGYYFLYLDNLKNLNLAENESPKTHVDGWGGQVIVSKLTRDGKHTKELLFDTREEDIMIFPANFNKIDQNRFIGRARLKRNLFRPILITSK